MFQVPRRLAWNTITKEGRSNPKKVSIYEFCCINEVMNIYCSVLLTLFESEMYIVCSILSLLMSFNDFSGMIWPLQSLLQRLHEAELSCRLCQATDGSLGSVQSVYRSTSCWLCLCGRKSWVVPCRLWTPALSRQGLHWRPPTWRCSVSWWLNSRWKCSPSFQLHNLYVRGLSHAKIHHVNTIKASTCLTFTFHFDSMRAD